VRRVRPDRLTLVQLALLAAVFVALRIKWPSVREFVLAIDHGDLFFADFVNHYYPTVAKSLREGAPAGGFFYPAAFAALLSPLSLLPPLAAEVAWGIVQLGCLIFVATTLVRVAADGDARLAALGTVLVASSVPVLHNLKWGQVSLLILAAAGGAYVLRARGRTWAPSALLAIAAAIKGYPLVFLGPFVVRGDARFLARAALACAVTLVILPAMVMGPLHALFVQRVSSGAVLGAREGVLRDFNSQYAPAVLSRYHGGWDATPVDVRAMSELASFAALAAVVALVVLVARSSAPAIARRREIFLLVLVASTVPFWLRTSWSHYFVHLPIAQIVMLRALDATWKSRLAVALLVVPSIVLSSVVGLFATRGWWWYADSGSLFFANALVLFACAGFAVDAHVRHHLATRPALAVGGSG
jgi:hypothetical protein